MEILDLHGVRYKDVEVMVENFVLINDLPVKIITGNSIGMREIVCNVLKLHQMNWNYESDYNLGSLIIT